VSVEARLLGATVAEGWSVMGDLLAGLRARLILVDGEEELSPWPPSASQASPLQMPLAPGPRRLPSRQLQRPGQ
jgi:hypothetical protein